VNASLERLRQIADEIRHLPDAHGGEGSFVLQTGGHLIYEAIHECGAFSDESHADFRAKVINAKLDADANANAKLDDPKNLCSFWRDWVFNVAANHFGQRVPPMGDDRISLVCGSIADAIETELKRMKASQPAATTDQSERNGAGGSTPGQSITDPNTNRAAVLKKMQPADRKAYLSYQYAETMAEKRLQDREAYNWLKENGIDNSRDDVWELADYKFPAFDTWSKQLRNARKLLGEQKYTRRGGRPTGRSIVNRQEIE
jgi:hypothetical protein